MSDNPIVQLLAAQVENCRRNAAVFTPDYTAGMEQAWRVADRLSRGVRCDVPRTCNLHDAPAPATELAEAREAFQAETAKRLEHEQTIADLKAQQQRALAEDRERIARAIEIKQGLRCPTCSGKASSTKSTSGYLVDRRCGGGHAWSAPAYRALDFAAIVRGGGVA